MGDKFLIWFVKELFVCVVYDTKEQLDFYITFYLKNKGVCRNQPLVGCVVKE